MLNVNLECTGAIYSYSVYNQNDIENLLAELEQKCNNTKAFNYLKKMAGWKKDYLVFADSIYNYMNEMQKMNDLYKGGSTEYIKNGNQYFRSGQCQAVKHLFHRNTIFSKAMESVRRLKEFNNTLKFHNLIQDGNKFYFVEKVS